LQSRLPPGVADLGFRQAMQKRWIKTEKGSKDPKVLRQVQKAGCSTAEQSLSCFELHVWHQELSQLSEPRALILQVDSVEDTVLQQLQAVDRGEALDKATGEALKKRKLVTLESRTTYKLTKGPKFALERKKQPTDLTTEMLKE
jgi:PheRS DNA binding domain 3